MTRLPTPEELATSFSPRDHSVTWHHLRVLAIRKDRAAICKLVEEMRNHLDHGWHNEYAKGHRKACDELLQALRGDKP